MFSIPSLLFFPLLANIIIYSFLLYHVLYNIQIVINSLKFSFSLSSFSFSSVILLFLFLSFLLDFPFYGLKIPDLSATKVLITILGCNILLSRTVLSKILPLIHTTLSPQNIQHHLHKTSYTVAYKLFVCYCCLGA